MSVVLISLFELHANFQPKTIKSRSNVCGTPPGNLVYYFVTVMGISILARMECLIPFQPEWNDPFHSNRNGMSHSIPDRVKWNGIGHSIPTGMEWAIPFRPE